MNKKKINKEKEQDSNEPAAQKNASEQVVDISENGQPKNEEARNVDIEQPDVEIDPTVLLEKDLNEYKDKYLRLSAEFDNYRKRTQREKMDLIKYGSEDVLKAIIPVVDDFERAMKSLDNSTDIDAVKQGLHLIHAKFAEFLKTNGVQEIIALGEELDTDVHEAITKTLAQDDKLKGKIVDVIEKGYKLNDRVIRFSKVVIGE